MFSKLEHSLLFKNSMYPDFQNQKLVSVTGKFVFFSNKKTFIEK